MLGRLKAGAVLALVLAGAATWLMFTAVTAHGGAATPTPRMSGYRPLSLAPARRVGASST